MTVETMNEDRLKRLIEAYGAAPARWPLEERAAAERYLADHPRDLAGLESERALDQALDAWAPQLATAALRERILAAAPTARRGWAPASWAGLWLSGAGLAAACAAGAIVGATMIAPSVAGAFPSDRSEASSLLSDGLSLFGSSLDMGLGG